MLAPLVLYHRIMLAPLVLYHLNLLFWETIQTPLFSGIGIIIIICLTRNTPFLDFWAEIFPRQTAGEGGGGGGVGNLVWYLVLKNLTVL